MRESDQVGLKLFQVLASPNPAGVSAEMTRTSSLALEVAGRHTVMQQEQLNPTAPLISLGYCAGKALIWSQL